MNLFSCSSRLYRGTLQPEPLPLPTPLTRLARLFLNRKDKAVFGGQQGRPQQEKPPQPGATRDIDNGGWNSSQGGALGRAEKGMVGGHDVASLRELRCALYYT